MSEPETLPRDRLDARSTLSSPAPDATVLRYDCNNVDNINEQHRLAFQLVGPKKRPSCGAICDFEEKWPPAAGIDAWNANCCSVVRSGGTKTSAQRRRCCAQFGLAQAMQARDASPAKIAFFRRGARKTRLAGLCHDAALLNSAEWNVASGTVAVPTPS